MRHYQLHLSSSRRRKKYVIKQIFEDKEVYNEEKYKDKECGKDEYKEDG